jgi:polyisoprenoid-binding protein YceI
MPISNTAVTTLVALFRSGMQGDMSAFRPMREMTHSAAVWILLSGVFLLPMPLHAARHSIDGEHSVIRIHVYKSGLFSIFAHDHDITTSIARGEIEDSENPSVEFSVSAGELRVVDTDLSTKDRAEVQSTMDGPDVLDIRRFPEIHFRSTAVQETGANRWMVRGDLELHGETHSVTVEVTERDGSYIGSTMLKQRDFGINPVKIAGGTVKVKDAVRIEFQVKRPTLQNGATDAGASR